MGPGDVAFRPGEDSLFGVNCARVRCPLPIDPNQIARLRLIFAVSASQRSAAGSRSYVYSMGLPRIAALKPLYSANPSVAGR